jgi:radical SAM/Cys-rich protein
MKRVLPTLQRQGARLSSGAEQQNRLHAINLPRSFDDALQAAHMHPLRPGPLEVLQLNLGKRCNQTCRHCHVDAGPDRTEVMPRAVFEACFDFAARAQVSIIDITGGAPELHPDFREIVTRAANCAHVLHRCNLTAILLPNYADIPELLARLGVEIYASLPYFQARETDAQRGEGVFEESIEGLRRLNALGYGRGSLELNLVTNPVGTYLPGSQSEMEARWKRILGQRYGISFDRLFTITNMPISRFLQFLEEKGRTEEYLRRLAHAFNPAAAAGIMCRNTLSVAWDGRLFDCDFNQMLDLPVQSCAPQTIFSVHLATLHQRDVNTGPHCFGCTAGSGSSCGGAVVQA